jgi:hypothetical protein
MAVETPGKRDRKAAQNERPVLHQTVAVDAQSYAIHAVFPVISRKILLFLRYEDRVKEKDTPEITSLRAQLFFRTPGLRLLYICCSCNHGIGETGLSHLSFRCRLPCR